jgi:uncharacterized Tic20 family protein
MSDAFENPYARKAELSPENQRIWAIVIHLGNFVAFLFLPIVAYLVFRQSGAFVSHHARNSLNFTLSMLLYVTVLSVSIVGLVLVPVVAVLFVILTVIAAVRASRGEFYEIPLTIKFIRQPV